jgi:Leucine-rich repeat (LRR) protein
VTKFKYLGTTLTEQNWMNEEIKERTKFGECLLPFGPVSSRLLSRNTKDKYIKKNITLPVLLCGCVTWSLTSRKEHKLRVFENRVLRRIFGPKRKEVTGEWRKLHNEELHILYSSQNIIRQIKSRRIRWAGMWHAWENRGKCTSF